VRRENPQDAKELLPFFVPKGKLRQLWLTFFASEVCLPGNYKGKVVITAQNTLPQEIELEVKVLPIKLLPPLLDYAIYYRGKLKEVSYSPEIGSEWKTKKQMEAELQNMKSHGIDNPTVYQPFVQRENGSYGLHLLREVIEIRKKIGITGKPLLYLGLGTGAPQQSEELEVLKKKVKSLITFIKKEGISDIYIYGIDEASGEQLKSERLAFKAVHEAGGKVFVACGSGFVDLVGDLLDLPIYNGIPPRSTIEKVHRFGHRIWNYGNPQCGVEEPLTYRRNYGLLLWQKGLDGTCDYAYQHAFGDIWDDFDHPKYRDHVMAYPTIDGVIPTIQWEGFREGVDDIRYLTTLIKIIHSSQTAINKPCYKIEVKEAKEFLKKIKALNLNNLSANDFQEIRWKIAQKIIELQKILENRIRNKFLCEK